MNAAVWLVIGAVTGWVASIALGHGAAGRLDRAVVGALGALLAGRLLAPAVEPFFAPAVARLDGIGGGSLVLAFLGALLLAAVHETLGRRASSRRSGATVPAIARPRRPRSTYDRRREPPHPSRED